MDAKRPQRLRFFLTLLVLTVTVGANAAYVIHFGEMDLALDFKVFWAAANSSIETLYRPSHMPFVNPPTAIFLFEPLGSLPRGPAFAIWTIVSILAFGLTVAVVTTWRVAILSFASAAAVKSMVLGQSAMLLAAAMFAALRIPPLASGALIGAVLAIKPQIALFAPLAFLVRRDWQVLQGMAASITCLGLASLTIFGLEAWNDWFRALPEFRRILVEDGVLSRVITPAGRAESAGLPSLPFLIAGLTIGGAAVIKSARHVENEKLIGLIVATSLIAAPYAHVHDTMALIPSCLILLWRGPLWLALPAAITFVGRPGLTMLALLLGVAGVAVAAIIDRGRQPAGINPGS